MNANNEKKKLRKHLIQSRNNDGGQKQYFEIAKSYSF